MRSMTPVSPRQCSGQSRMWLGEGLWIQQWLPLHLSGVWVISFTVPETVLRGGGGVKQISTALLSGGSG